MGIKKLIIIISLSLSSFSCDYNLPDSYWLKKDNSDITLPTKELLEYPEIIDIEIHRFIFEECEDSVNIEKFVYFSPVKAVKGNGDIYEYLDTTKYYATVQACPDSSNWKFIFNNSAKLIHVEKVEMF